MNFEDCKDCINFKKKKQCNEIILENWCQKFKRPIALMPSCHINKSEKAEIINKKLLFDNFSRPSIVNAE